jgi:hypothetical protein
MYWEMELKLHEFLTSASFTPWSIYPRMYTHCVSGRNDAYASLNVMEMRILASMGSNPDYAARIRSELSNLMHPPPHTHTRTYIKANNVNLN